MRILLVDDHPVFRSSLELLLKNSDRSVEALHAGSCGEGIRIARKRALNLVFLDLPLPDGDGLGCQGDEGRATQSTGGADLWRTDWPGD